MLGKRDLLDDDRPVNPLFLADEADATRDVLSDVPLRLLDLLPQHDLLDLRLTEDESMRLLGEQCLNELHVGSVCEFSRVSARFLSIYVRIFQSIVPGQL